MSLNNLLPQFTTLPNAYPSSVFPLPYLVYPSSIYPIPPASSPYFSLTPNPFTERGRG